MILFRTHLWNGVQRSLGTLRNSEKYRTVQVTCLTCNAKIFNYKKKNGTKSNLVKIYMDRIVKDHHNILNNCDTEIEALQCPHCRTVLAKHALLSGHKILKCIGNRLKLN